MPGEAHNRSMTIANGRDQFHQWAQVTRRASTRIIRIIPSNAHSQDERRSTRNAQGGRGRGQSNGQKNAPNNGQKNAPNNGQKNAPNNGQTGTGNATRERGRKHHECFARNMRDEHNNADL
jgi:hypothetical protein